MEISNEYLEKCIIWNKLRFYGDINIHRNNIINFYANRNLINGEINAQIALNTFKNLTELNENLINLIPNFSLRYLYNRLAICIIEEDYIKAEEFKNKIFNFKK